MWSPGERYEAIGHQSGNHRPSLKGGFTAMAASGSSASRPTVMRSRYGNEPGAGSCWSARDRAGRCGIVPPYRHEEVVGRACGVTAPVPGTHSQRAHDAAATTCSDIGPETELNRLVVRIWQEFASGGRPSHPQVGAGHRPSGGPTRAASPSLPRAPRRRHFPRLQPAMSQTRLPPRPALRRTGGAG